MIKVAASQYLGQVAQLVEHGPEKAGVGGSSPPLTTFSPASDSEAPKKAVFSGFFGCHLTSPKLSYSTFQCDSRK
jgi:hypothetical protein